jgi:hypothetical protein
MTGYTPRLRASLEDINGWLMGKSQKPLMALADFWPQKAAQGDPSDNLPPGSPLEVIDLLKPPPEHRLWDQPGVYAQLAQSIFSPPFNRDQGEAADRWLRSNGYRPAVRPVS